MDVKLCQFFLKFTLIFFYKRFSFFTVLCWADNSCDIKQIFFLKEKKELRFVVEKLEMKIEKQMPLVYASSSSYKLTLSLNMKRFRIKKFILLALKLKLQSVGFSCTPRTYSLMHNWRKWQELCTWTPVWSKRIGTVRADHETNQKMKICIDI